ncbi:MAG TPA: MFS transporter [Calditrichaeota bacterium]|nr:MFS transporter [Calditrichota bacterium]
MRLIPRTKQFYKFCAYGFLKNLRLFDAFFLLFLLENGLPYLQIGILYTIRQITIYIWEVPSGLIADALGRKKTLLFSLAAYLISFILFFISNIFPFFALAMVSYGIGEAFRSGTHKAMILEYLRLNDLTDLKTRYYGATRSWSQLGSAVSSLLAMGVVLTGQNYKQLFLFTAIPYLLDFINIATYPAELDKSHGATGNPILLRSVGDRFRQTWQNFKNIFRHKESVRAIFSAASYIAIYKGAKDYIQPMIQTAALSMPFFIEADDSKRTAVLVGIIYFCLYLLSSFASRNAWRFENSFKPLSRSINIAYLAGVTAIALSGIFLSFKYTAAAIIVFIFIYILQNIRRPLVVSYLSEVIPSRVMASGLSAESQLETIVLAIFAPLLGFMADQWGLAAALVISGLLFLSLFPFVRLKEKAIIE